MPHVAHVKQRTIGRTGQPHLRSCPGMCVVVWLVGCCGSLVDASFTVVALLLCLLLLIMGLCLRRGLICVGSVVLPSVVVVLLPASLVGLSYAHL